MLSLLGQWRSGRWLHGIGELQGCAPRALMPLRGEVAHSASRAFSTSHSKHPVGAVGSGAKGNPSTPRDADTVIMRAQAPYRRTAPRRIVSLASLEHLNEKPMLSGWSPDVVELRVGEILRDADKDRTRAELTRLFERMHRTGAPLLLQERVFNELQRRVRPSLRLYAAMIRAHARAASGNINSAWRCEELYLSCAAQYSFEFRALGIVVAVHKASPPAAIAQQQHPVGGGTSETAASVDTSVATLYALAVLFEAMVTALCRARQPLRALPFVSALYSLRSRYDASLGRQLASSGGGHLSTSDTAPDIQYVSDYDHDHEVTIVPALYPQAYARLLSTACTSLVSRLASSFGAGERKGASSSTGALSTGRVSAYDQDPEVASFVQYACSTTIGLQWCEQLVAWAESCKAESVSLYTALLSAHLHHLQAMRESDFACALSSPRTETSFAWHLPARVAEAIRLRMLGRHLGPDFRFIALSALVISCQNRVWHVLHAARRDAVTSSRSHDALIVLRNWLLHYLAAVPSQSHDLRQRVPRFRAVNLLPSAHTFNSLLRVTVLELKSTVQEIRNRQSAGDSDSFGRAVALVERGERLFDELCSHPLLMPDAVTCALLMELYCVWGTRSTDTLPSAHQHSVSGNTKPRDGSGGGGKSVQFYLPDFVLDMHDELCDSQEPVALAVAWAARTGIDRATHFLMWLSTKNISTDSHAMCIELLRRAHVAANVRSRRMVEICQQFSLVGVRLLSSTYRGNIRMLVAERQFDQIQPQLDALLAAYGTAAITPSLLTDVLIAWGMQPSMNSQAMYLFALMERGASLDQVVCALAQKSSDSSPVGPVILPLPHRETFLATPSATSNRRVLSLQREHGASMRSPRAPDSPLASSSASVSAFSNSRGQHAINKHTTDVVKSRDVRINQDTEARDCTDSLDVRRNRMSMLAQFSFLDWNRIFESVVETSADSATCRRLVSLSGCGEWLLQPPSATQVLVPSDVRLATSTTVSVPSASAAGGNEVPNVDLDSIRSALEEIASTLLALGVPLATVHQTVFSYFQPAAESVATAPAAAAAWYEMRTVAPAGSAHTAMQDRLSSQIPPPLSLAGRDNLEAVSFVDSLMQSIPAQHEYHRLGVSIDACHVMIHILGDNAGNVAAAWRLCERYFVVSTIPQSVSSGGQKLAPPKLTPTGITFQLMSRVCSSLESGESVRAMKSIVTTWQWIQHSRRHASGESTDRFDCVQDVAMPAPHVDGDSANLVAEFLGDLRGDSAFGASRASLTAAADNDFSIFANMLLRDAAQRRQYDLMRHVLAFVRTSSQSFVPTLNSFHSVLLAEAQRGNVDGAAQLVRALSVACDADGDQSPSVSSTSSLRANLKTWKLVLEAHLNAGQLEPALQVLQHMLAHASDATASANSSRYKQLNTAANSETLIRALNMTLTALTDRYHADAAVALFGRCPGVRGELPVDERGERPRETQTRLHNTHVNAVRLFRASARGGRQQAVKTMPAERPLLALPPPLDVFEADSRRLCALVSTFPDVLPLHPNLHTFHVILRALALAERADDVASIVEGPLVLALFDARRNHAQQQREQQQQQLFGGTQLTASTMAPPPREYLPAALRRGSRNAPTTVAAAAAATALLESPRSAFFLEDALPLLAWHGHVRALHAGMFVLAHHQIVVPRMLALRVVRARLLRGDVVGARALLRRFVDEFGTQLTDADRARISAWLGKITEQQLVRQFSALGDDERASIQSAAAAAAAEAAAPDDSDDSEASAGVRFVAPLAAQVAARNDWLARGTAATPSRLL